MSIRMEDRGYATLCHVWTGAISPEGYARRGARYVHRERYEGQHGPIPIGLEIDHLCRIRQCVNPDHMEAVTRKVNARRGAKAKLTEASVTEIRSRLCAGERNADLAVLFGVSRPTIANIKARRVWA